VTTGKPSEKGGDAYGNISSVDFNVGFWDIHHIGD